MPDRVFFIYVFGALVKLFQKRKAGESSSSQIIHNIESNISAWESPSPRIRERGFY